jgi:hypothetical protein
LIEQLRFSAMKQAACKTLLGSELKRASSLLQSGSIAIKQLSCGASARTFCRDAAAAGGSTNGADHGAQAASGIENASNALGKPI